MEWIMGDFLLSDDQNNIDINKVHSMLSKTYWASHRTSDIILKSIQNSLLFGIYLNNEQVGFAHGLYEKFGFIRKESMKRIP